MALAAGAHRADTDAMDTEIRPVEPNGGVPGEGSGARPFAFGATRAWVISFAVALASVAFVVAVVALAA